MSSRLFSTLFERAADRRSRRRLARLDAHLLRDIGVSRAQALAEAGRTDWTAPRHWLR